ncbi:uncharacterized protein LOC108048635 isoform X1 [Drosophila rhopaloa]|uniref:Uncharacterized protein LOC108048635 isoform X1 n=1 Tax=Drosophila rhopaloa TaxID=1041015 RepID=A0A6P4F3B4_DRORH|nr:uncharacterized protein LOC108048635 isoform X1 [Drosophila rhopaloa]
MSTCSTVVVSKTKPQFKILVNNVLIIPSQTTGEIEMCLRLFFGFTSLYLGCIFIGLSGIVFAVVIFSVGLFELIMGNPELLLVILAMVFGFVYAVAKLFLLFGTMWDMCWALLLSFLIGLVSLALLVGLVVLFYLVHMNTLHLLLGATMCLIELYYEWIIISTWWCCRSCMHDC